MPKLNDDLKNKIPNGKEEVDEESTTSSLSEPIGCVLPKTLPEINDVVDIALYRGDSRPGLFHEGFKALGNNKDLMDHVFPRLYGEGSAYISTSLSKDVAANFPKGLLPANATESYVYEIHSSRPKININADFLYPEYLKGQIALNTYSLYSNEKEIAFFKEISPTEIKGFWQVDVEKRMVQDPAKLAELNYSKEEIDLHAYRSKRTLTDKFIPNPNYQAPMYPEIQFWNLSRRLGYALTAVNLVVDANHLYQEYEVSSETGNYDNTYRESAKILGGWTGAFIMGAEFATTGSIYCAPFSPYASAACAVGFGIVGSILGYTGGEYVATRIYDARREKEIEDQIYINYYRHQLDEANMQIQQQTLSLLSQQPQPSPVVVTHSLTPPSPQQPNQLLSLFSGNNDFILSTLQTNTLTIGEKEKTFLTILGKEGISTYLYENNNWVFKGIGPQWLLQNGWREPLFHSTIQTNVVILNGQEKIVMTARAANGIHTYIYDGVGWTFKGILPAFSHENGWSNHCYYSTIQTNVMKINGQDQLVLTARGAAGLYTYFFDGSTWQFNTNLNIFSDANGWKTGCYYSSIQTNVMNINGKDHLVLTARGAAGVYVFIYDPNLNTWTHKGTEQTFADANGWNQPTKYRSIIATVIEVDEKSSLVLTAQDESNKKIFCYDEKSSNFVMQGQKQEVVPVTIPAPVKKVATNPIPPKPAPVVAPNPAPPQPISQMRESFRFKSIRGSGAPTLPAPVAVAVAPNPILVPTGLPFKKTSFFEEKRKARQAYLQTPQGQAELIAFQKEQEAKAAKKYANVAVNQASMQRTRSQVNNATLQQWQNYNNPTVPITYQPSSKPIGTPTLAELSNRDLVNDSQQRVNQQSQRFINHVKNEFSSGRTPTVGSQTQVGPQASNTISNQNPTPIQTNNNLAQGPSTQSTPPTNGYKDTRLPTTITVLEPVQLPPVQLPPMQTNRNTGPFSTSCTLFNGNNGCEIVCDNGGPSTKIPDHFCHDVKKSK